MGRDAKAPDVITREYTINLGKAITGITFKSAPRAPWRRYVFRPRGSTSERSGR
jgi:hypothetical protein